MPEPIQTDAEVTPTPTPATASTPAPNQTPITIITNPTPAQSPVPEPTITPTEELPAIDPILTQYQALGSPEEITAQLNELHTMQRTEQVRQLANHMQWKSTVLSDRISSLPEGVEVLLVGSGQTQTAVVRLNNQDTPLSEYAQTNWADYLPALTNGVGTPFINQSSTPQGDTPKKDVVAERLKEREESAPASPFAKKEN